jgi:hypothetical protein
MRDVIVWLILHLLKKIFYSFLVLLHYLYTISMKNIFVYVIYNYMYVNTYMYTIINTFK